MTPAELVLFAYRHGHHWNPQFPNLQNLDAGRVAKMKGTERDAKDLMHSWQTFDYNVILLSAYYGHGEPEAEGKIGKASEFVAAMNRCPMPDFKPPPGATFDTGIPELNKAWETMQAFATGSGAWPAPGCDGNTPHHSIVVRIDPANCPATIKAYLDKALAECVTAYAEIGLAVRYLLASSGKCNIAKRFQSLPGSVIGWNEFPPNGNCNAEIEGRLDTGYAPGNWLLWANLECHETGHGVGLEHTRGSIMNPSILLVDPMRWPGTPSYPDLKDYYGGQPINVPGPGPGPGPSPGEPKLVLKVTTSGLLDAVAKRDFTAKAGEVLEQFTIIPKIR